MPIVMRQRQYSQLLNLESLAIVPKNSITFSNDKRTKRMIIPGNGRRNSFINIKIKIKTLNFFKKTN